MANPITSALSTASLATAGSTSTAVAARNPQPPPPPPADTVQLSEAQQVYQLYNQGQTASQIATSLSLSVSEVNIYLGGTGGKI
jgi:DNA-binding NarL/FixJ family response regulator